MAEASTRGALACLFESKRLWLIQFFANPILILLYAACLLVPEARTWELILNVILALAIAVFAVVLHAGTLNYFHDRARSDSAALKPAFLRALRNILAISLWIVVFFVVWRLWGMLGHYHESIPTYFCSLLPAWLRRHVTLHSMIKIFEIKLFVLRWVVTLGFLLPFAAQAADRGFGGFGKSGRTALESAIKSLRYWAAVIVAALMGVCFSSRLLNWHSHSQDSTFAGETTSLVLRLLAAYLLALFSWMLVCSVAGRSCGIQKSAGGNTSL
ncbi:MAG: hypothetical protein ACRD4K_14245 [Candidatus Acidiferrales bacterium]